MVRSLNGRLKMFYFCFSTKNCGHTASKYWYMPMELSKCKIGIAKRDRIPGVEPACGSFSLSLSLDPIYVSIYVKFREEEL